MSIEKIHSSHTNTWPSSICSQPYLAVRNIKYFVHGTMLNWVSACLQMHAWGRFALSWKDESLGEWLKLWREKIFALRLEPFYTIRLIAVISGLGLYITCSHGWSCLLNNLSLGRWYNTNAWRCVASFLNFHYFSLCPNTSPLCDIYIWHRLSRGAILHICRIPRKHHMII